MAGAREGKGGGGNGGSRGIGGACAIELARHGASVVVNYINNLEAAKSCVAEIEGVGSKAIVVQADVSDAEQAQRLIDEAIEAFGKIDILVNNAGINRDRTVARMSVEEWDEVVQTDLSSMFYCTRAVVAGMRERNYGRIINMSSIIGQMGNPGQANYAAAKAGIVGFSKSAAQELARFNITVNALCPGFIETEMVINLTDEVKEALLANVPLGRFGKPEEVAAITRFLVSEGDYVTGAQINSNGGMYMQ